MAWNESNEKTEEQLQHEIGCLGEDLTSKLRCCILHWIGFRMVNERGALFAI